jgi:hypothetical protein
MAPPGKGKKVVSKLKQNKLPARVVKLQTKVVKRLKCSVLLFL